MANKNKINTLPFMAYIISSVLAVVVFGRVYAVDENQDVRFWNFQSIDTMKYSRDLAREKLSDKTFDSVIDSQVKAIADVGATHIAIATPYDDEFRPFMLKWVTAARKYGLNVWYRGNWAGWEGWFEYPKITREEHIQKTKELIINHRELFEPGDIFSGCPECENGGKGDPRQTGDIEGFRQFLIDEYKVTSEQFRLAGVSVKSNYIPMNADIAKLIMDPATTRALGGVVVIDHYVETPEQLLTDIEEIRDISGGNIVLGELGVPIPDIHGNMTASEQAEWLDSALSGLTKLPYVDGVSYWTNIGGSTQIWNSDVTPKTAALMLEKYYTPRIFSGKVMNELEKPISGAIIHYNGREYIANDSGVFKLPTVEDSPYLEIMGKGYKKQNYRVITSNSGTEIVLEKSNESLLFILQKIFSELIKNLFS